MAKKQVWTDQAFSTEKEAWEYVSAHYSVQGNKIMRAYRESGMEVSVGVRKRRSQYFIVIVVG